MLEERKRAKLQKEDRISELPDSVIHHILSLLPSTKESIQTSVLSKRWHNQWTHVPVLIFNNSGMSDTNFSRFIDNTLLLHDCSKIHKFHIRSNEYFVEDDPHFNSKLRFAIRKNVEELILEFRQINDVLRLPDFLLCHTSLVKLHIYNCVIVGNSNMSVRWEHLRELKVEYSDLDDIALESILIGSPLLELLELIDWYSFNEPSISSNSLKKLVVEFGDSDSFEMDISCPKLEELKLLGVCGSISIRCKDLSSLICATLDFDVWGNEYDQNLAEIMQRLKHVKELTFGKYFIECLTRLKDSNGQFSGLLNIKSLTLDRPDFRNYPAGIAYALRVPLVLEKLVVRNLVYETGDFSTFWDSKAIASHRKTLHIVGLGKRSRCEIPLEFVDFVLKNAPVLEKLVMLKDI